MDKHVSELGQQTHGWLFGSLESVPALREQSTQIAFVAESVRQLSCMQVIEHDDEETHASFSPLSTGASLRSFPGTPFAARYSDDLSTYSGEARGDSAQGILNGLFISCLRLSDGDFSPAIKPVQSSLLSRLCMLMAA